MAALKLHIFFLFFVLILTLSEADSAVEEVVINSDNSETLRLELNKLTSKFHSLESLVEKKTEELITKDETIAKREKAIAEKEKTLFEKPDSITSFKDNVASLKSYVESHWKEHGKPVLESLKQKALETNEQAERWAGHHMQTFKTKWVPAAREQWVLVVTNVEPQLQSLTIKTKGIYIQFKEVVDHHFQKWILPAWEQWALLATNVEPQLQSLITETKEKWIPAVREQSMWVVLNVKRQLQSLTKKTKEKWIPTAREQWVLVVSNVEPQLQSLTKKTKDVYIQSKDALPLYLIKIKEAADPHFQILKKASKPYIDKIANATNLIW